MILFQWFESRVSFFFLLLDVNLVTNVGNFNAHNLFVDMPQLIAEIARAFLILESVCVRISGRSGYADF